MLRLMMLTALPFLTACAAQPARQAPPLVKVVQSEHSVRLALLPPSREGHAALASGTLIVDGPCLYLGGPDGSRWTAAFVTFDTRWESGGLMVGDRRFVAGQRVSLGGGEVSGAASTLPWVQAPDPGCDTSSIWIAVSIEPA